MFLVKHIAHVSIVESWSQAADFIGMEEDLFCKLETKLAHSKYFPLCYPVIDHEMKLLVINCRDMVRKIWLLLQLWSIIRVFEIKSDVGVAIAQWLQQKVEQLILHMVDDSSKHHFINTTRVVIAYLTVLFYSAESWHETPFISFYFFHIISVLYMSRFSALE